MTDDVAVSDEHLLALGRLAYHAAQLEFIVEVLLNELIDEDPAVGAAMTGGMSFAARHQRILALIPLRDEDELFSPLFRDHLAWAKQAMEERNRLLHSRWVHREDGSAVQVRGKTITSRVLWEVSVEDVADAARDMAKVFQALELDWAGFVVRTGRTTPVEGSPGFVYPPDRWSVEGEVRPAKSKSKTDQDRYVEGTITWDEYQQRNSP